MFDFLRDTMLELKGIDANKAREEREKIKAEKEKNKVIFSLNMKRALIAISVFFLISYCGTIPILFKANQMGLLVKNLIQIILIIGLWVAFAQKTKTGEMAAIIICILFFAVQYLSTAFLLT